jgi:hypothetical protein
MRINRRKVVAGAASVAASAALPNAASAVAPVATALPVAAAEVTKPAWLVAAEATGTADYQYGFHLIDALMHLRWPGKGKDVLDPENYDATMQLEFARALNQGYATLTPDGRLRITPEGIRAEEREWADADCEP